MKIPLYTKGQIYYIDSKDLYVALSIIGTFLLITIIVLLT